MKYRQALRRTEQGKGGDREQIGPYPGRLTTSMKDH